MRKANPVRSLLSGVPDRYSYPGFHSRTHTASRRSIIPCLARPVRKIYRSQCLLHNFTLGQHPYSLPTLQYRDVTQLLLSFYNQFFPKQTITFNKFTHSTKMIKIRSEQSRILRDTPKSQVVGFYEKENEITFQ